MNPALNLAWGHAIGVMIVVLMLTFIGIWIWAWLPFHKKTFDALARLPLHDDTLEKMREGEQP
jgi:cytochrome c oxidase cbb3-type subunit IV